MASSLNLVWLKRDLRTQDHAPFQAAEQAGVPYIPIYIFEPSALNRPDSSLRHWRFVWQSIADMNERLPREHAVTVFYGEATVVFAHLIQQYPVQEVFSYQESGTQPTFNRDVAIKKLFSKKHIGWTEFQRDGIIRGIENRDGWDKQWFATMHQPPIVNTCSELLQGVSDNPFPSPPELEEKLSGVKGQFQIGGESEAHRILDDFLNERGRNYRKHISKPLESHESCSRLSPYLAWGNISVKQAYQNTRNHEHFKKHKGAFSAFTTRLKWRDHKR